MLERIIDGLSLHTHYARSISLSRDLGDETAIASYLLTPNALQALKHIGTALANGDAQKAWKLVGPYGSGKSALALVLAQLLAGPDAFPAARVMLRSASTPVAKLFAASNRYTLAIVGARLSIGAALEAEIRRALKEWPQTKPVASLLKHLSDAGVYKGRPSNAVAGELLRDFAVVARSQGHEGVMLMVDEVGKFVEHAALHPEDGDLMALQQLAEEACRPGDATLGMIVLQHQHFASYAAGIGRALGEEWHKVSSRFEEIPFDEPVERYAHFAAHALGTKPALYRDATLIAEAKSVFDAALDQGILRAPTSADKALFQQAHKLYPLQPLTLAALAIVSKRYGQSERSFHAFLSSNEPGGLRDFAQVTPVTGHAWLRLPQLFDYLASGNGLRFRDLTAERRWAFALASIESKGLSGEAVAVLKAVAVLELVQASLSQRITVDLVAFALGMASHDHVKALLDELVAQGLLIHRRSRAEFGFALSEAVNVEGLYEDAAQLGDEALVVSGAKHALSQRHVVANKHYDRTGTIRTVGIDVGTVTAWPKFDPSKDAEIVPDAWLRLVLATNGSLQELQAQQRMATLNDPLELHCCLSLTPHGRAALAELAIWLQVQKEVRAKRLDPWTSQYVDGRVHRAKEEADALVFSSLAPSPGRPGHDYWHLGQKVPGGDQMNISQVASWMFEKVFHQAPRIVNELINKDRPASAIVLARQRLMDVVLEGPREGPLFNEKEFPPERLIHATLLRDTGIWQDQGSSWTLSPPKSGMRVDITVIWAEISRVLSNEQPPTFEQVLQALAAAPFGVRGGPASVWVIMYLLVHRGRCAVFERGTLVLELSGEHLQRMHKNPQTFELRELPQTRGGRNLLRDYVDVLASVGSVVSGESTYLELARSLYRWFFRLSDFAQQTGRVGKNAVLVRSALRKAQDPIKLLTVTLPQAHAQTRDSRPFPAWLSAALSDLGMSQRLLQEAVIVELGRSLDIGGSLTKIRGQLQAECSGAAGDLADAQLKSFTLRCTDLTLTDEQWLNSVASLLVQRPLDTWSDDHFVRFVQAITETCGHYRRWLRLVQQRGGAPRAAERFVSLTMTSPEGKEAALFVATSPQSTELARSVTQLLAKEASANPQIAAAALAQAMQELHLMQLQLNTEEGEQDGQRQAG